jgi:hypothetical protein
MPYLYFIVNSQDHLDERKDEKIFIKIGKTIEPWKRISNYATHHIGDHPPAYYKIWKVADGGAEEKTALDRFKSNRVIKDGHQRRSEVVTTTKTKVDKYKPDDPDAKLVDPVTFKTVKQSDEEVEELTHKLEKVQLTPRPAGKAPLVKSKSVGDAEKSGDGIKKGKSTSTAESPLINPKGTRPMSAGPRDPEYPKKYELFEHDNIDQLVAKFLDDGNNDIKLCEKCPGKWNLGGQVQCPVCEKLHDGSSIIVRLNEDGKVWVKCTEEEEPEKILLCTLRQNKQGLWYSKKETHPHA